MVLVQKELKNAYIWIPFPESITLDKSSISLNTAWQTEQITATLTPSICDKTITWTSSDTSVATVSSTGLVTCVTPWTATITATTVNGLTATCGVAAWWSPWANTIWYYKMDWNLNDSSWKGNNLTIGVTPTFENNWLKTGYWYKSSFIWDKVTFNFRFNNSTTSNQILIAVYTNTNYSYNYRWDVLRLNEPSSWYIKSASYDGSWYYYWNSAHIGYNDGINHNACITRDGTTVKVYIDWDYKFTGTLASYYPSLLTIKCKDHQSYGCLLDEVIVEDRVWTDTEVGNYYNQTKADYGR